MYREQQLQTALKELNIEFQEDNGNYKLDKNVKFKIATPRTEFVFESGSFKIERAEDLIIDFPGISFKTEAPFVDFIATKEGYLYIRLSNTKF